MAGNEENQGCFLLIMWYNFYLECGGHDIIVCRVSWACIEMGFMV